MKTMKLMKTLVAVGLLTTTKIVANHLMNDPLEEEKRKREKAERDLEMVETGITEILGEIRSEMVHEMNKLSPNEKLLKNYVRGRIATLDDIEKRRNG